MNDKLKNTGHLTSKDITVFSNANAIEFGKCGSQSARNPSISKIAKAITLVITICIIFAYTKLSAQQTFYEDLVIFKDGNILNGVNTYEENESLIVRTFDGMTTKYSKNDVSEVIKRAFYAKAYKDLVILKDGTMWNGTQTIVTKDSLIVNWETGETKIQKNKDVSEVMKGVFDISKGFLDTVTLKDGTVIEPVQTLVIRDLLLVFKEDRTAIIYKAVEVSRVEKVKAEVTVKAGETFTSQTGIELVSIPAGEFIMGCSEGDNQCRPDEKPAHKVKITKSFYMGKYEVTQRQWKAVMGANPSYFLGEKCDSPKGCDNYPVEQVRWNDIKEFLTKLNAKEGRTGDKMYRLPTEAEWEYAARSGTATKYYANDFGSIAWYDENSGRKTHPVGQKKPNAFGLYDMLGNVWESVSDWYADNQYSASETTDPIGTNAGSHRVKRGGSWLYPAKVFRLSSRSWSDSENYVSNDYGFRVVVLQAKVKLQPTPISGKWSEYQGNMNWEDAKKKCASIGMRLPTFEELKTAYAAGITEPWISDGSYYWSSTPMGDYLAHILHITNGDNLVYYTYHTHPVRCLEGVYRKKEVSEDRKAGEVNSTNATKKDPKPTPSSGKWSEYQGNMNWDDAKRKCASIGMRLPTRDELVAARKTGLSEKWTGEEGLLGRYYWTSEEYPVESAYFVSMDNGHIGHYVDRSWYGIPNNVRCVP